MSEIVSEQIKYVGVNDRDLDLFEGQYVVPNGISYNSYVILDEKWFFWGNGGLKASTTPVFI